MVGLLLPPPTATQRPQNFFFPSQGRQRIERTYWRPSPTDNGYVRDLLMWVPQICSSPSPIKGWIGLPQTQDTYHKTSKWCLHSNQRGGWEKLRANVIWQVWYRKAKNLFLIVHFLSNSIPSITNGLTYWGKDHNCFYDFLLVGKVMWESQSGKVIIWLF
jgi:hypothetical protein